MNWPVLDGRQADKVTREVALARFSLPLPEHPGEELDLRVSLIRDLSRQVLDEK